VRFSENMKEVFLTGPAHVIYQGTVRVG